MTNYSRSVLKSNGLPYPKIQLKKFSFSPKLFPQISSESYRYNSVPNRFSSRFSTSRTNGPRLLLWAKVGTHSASPTRSHTRAHTAKQVVFWVGVVSLPSERFARFGNPARPGVRTANFAAFGSWSGVLPKNVESLRNSDALMRVAVPRRRGPAGLRDPIAVSLTALIGFTVLADRDYRVRKKAHFVFMHRAALPALPAPSAALLYALMH